MNVLYVSENESRVMPCSLAETAEDICCGDLPDVIQTCGARGAMFSCFLRTNARYSPYFRRTRIVHTVGEDEVGVTFPEDEYTSADLGDLIKNISAGGRIYPTAGAVIYCDRVIVRSRALCAESGPLLPHYMRQFGFKVYELPGARHEDYERIYFELTKPKLSSLRTDGV